MDYRKRMTLPAALLLMAGLLLPAHGWAQGDDLGMSLNAGLSKKINKKWSLGAETELRTRNDCKTFDRWTVGADLSYRLVKHLKLQAGYTFLLDNNEEKINYHTSGTVNNWRPSYTGLRHRVGASLTGDVDLGPFNVSLRERWQYTYRPEKTVQRYDFDDQAWEDKVVGSRARHVLRSRLQVEYNIPHCKVDPYASVELFNAWSLQKIRYTGGFDWKVKKQHVLGAFYRYQHVSSDDEGEPNRHVIGLGYKFKF